jgi:hypothetical protein
MKLPNLPTILDMDLQLLSPLLWLIFTGYFFYMSYKEYKWSNSRLESLDQFSVKEKGGTRFDAGFSPGEAFFAMRNELNISNQTSHSIAASSFLAAGLTALSSFVLSLVQVL